MIAPPLDKKSAIAKLEGRLKVMEKRESLALERLNKLRDDTRKFKIANRAELMAKNQLIDDQNREIARLQATLRFHFLKKVRSLGLRIISRLTRCIKKPLFFLVKLCIVFPISTLIPKSILRRLTTKFPRTQSFLMKIQNFDSSTAGTSRRAQDIENTLKMTGTV